MSRDQMKMQAGMSVMAQAKGNSQVRAVQMLGQYSDLLIAGNQPCKAPSLKRRNLARVRPFFCFKRHLE